MGSRGGGAYSSLDYDIPTSEDEANQFIDNYQENPHNAYDNGWQSFDDAVNMWSSYLSDSDVPDINLGSKEDSWRTNAGQEPWRDLPGMQTTGKLSPDDFAARRGDTGEKDFISDILSKFSGMYNGAGKEEKKAFYSALASIGTQYMNKDLKKAQLNSYNTSADIARQRLEMDKKAYDDEMARRKAAEESMRRVGGIKPVGLLGYQPLQRVNIANQIAKG